MDKNIIKELLAKRFVTEDTTPIKVTADVEKKNAKINKAGVAAIEKDVKAYDKDLKQKDKNMGQMATNKYNYTNDSEKTYHDEMETLNGQEMIKYTSEPGKEFAQRSKESIEGSTRMGNKVAANAEEAWGSAKDSFGKELVNRIKNSERKRAIADAPIDSLTSLGDKIAYPNDKVKVNPDKTAMSAGGGKNDKNDKTPVKKSAPADKPQKKVEENNNNNKPLITTSMKRLTFKKPFNGWGNALKMIPEGYRVDKKEFEMTDGIETYKIRWEGTLTEGKAIALTAVNKKNIKEDISRMKELMGYKPEATLGLMKGKDRVDENKVFGDIWSKTKKLMTESEDIEDVKAKEGDLDDAVNTAKEASKDIEGSVPTDKKTEAPAPKEGAWEEAPVKQASEAKAHVEGSVPTDPKTNAPKPKEGNWEEIKKKSADATKDIETAKTKVTEKAKVVTENEEEVDEPEAEDTWNKPSPDDDDGEVKEPTAKDIKREAPPIETGDDDEVTVPPAPKGGAMPEAATILFSPSSGEYWLKKGDATTKVPDEYLAIASDKTKKAPVRAKMIIDAMQEKADSGVEEPVNAELDEYGDEHEMSVTDALKK